MPEAHLNANDGSIIARMEVGDSIFGGAVDMNFVHAQAELTQADGTMCFLISRSPSSGGSHPMAGTSIALSDSVTYDRISYLSTGKMARVPQRSAVTDLLHRQYFGPVPGCPSGYTVPDGYVLSFEDNFDQIGQAPDAEHWTLETGASGWGNNELQNYTNSTDNSVIVDVGVTDGDTDQANDGVNGHSKSRLSATVARSPRHV